MLTRIWTGFLLSGLCASLVALAFVCMREKGFRPYVDLWAKFRRLPLRRQIAVVMFVVGMWVYASVKPGDGGSGGDGGGDGGGTNNIQMVIGPGGLPQASSPGAVTNTLGHGVVGEIRPMSGGTLGDPAQFEDEWSDFVSITSTNTTRTLTGEDFRRGFVMTQIETGEEHDFSAPSDATIVSDWQAFGAATDWIYVALTNWAFSVATNEVERLRVYSFGKIEPLVSEADNAIATNYWFAPFLASLGVVPEANWDWLAESDRPSQVWYAITPQNSLVVTWRNALLDRDTGKPLSFQAEFKTNGQFTYRYDLSRLDAETVTNILAGVSFAGNEWTTNSLPTNITSMAFCPLLPGDAYDEDSDGDGVATIDELFVHYTDPHNADTDYDGLSDGEEILVHETNPLDPNSISAAYCDGFAAKLGDLDPFSCPEGSTNTVLEHIFYSGTTNGIVAYPTSTVDTAVLKVMVSGVGTGRLVVGDAVVPLVAPPQLRSGAVTNTLLLEVGRGVRKEVWFTKPDGLDVALRSDDLLIGSLPNLFWPHGWIAFPHTDATIPCIHDLCAEQRWVSLVHGEEFPGLTATWESESLDIEIWNDGIVTAEITGHFPKNASRVVTYTVDHPNRLSPTPKTFQQTVRFCPRLAESDLAEYGIEDEDTEPSEGWCMCGWGCDWCYGRCSGNCPCCMAQVLDETTEETSAAEYARIAALQEVSGVLQLYGPSGRVDSVLLQVPAGEPIHCCECPEHWQSNHVALAWRSQRLSVLDSSDADFVEAFENVQVRVLGTAPSPAVGADAVLFATNGTPSVCRRYTVLGVNVENHSGPSIETYNALNASFGLPMTICTNLERGAELSLRTDVLLTNGVYRLALENVTGRFEVWTAGCEYWVNSLSEPELVVVPPVKLLDSESSTERYFTMRQWRSLLAEYSGYGRTLPVLVISPEVGHCALCVSFVYDDGGRSIKSSVRQRITSVKPPLLPDYDQDGVIGDADVAEYLGCRAFRFWTNEDTEKGDYLGQNSDATPNAADLVVNGRLDLVNLFPLKLDLKPFIDSWGSEATFVLWEPGNALRFCGADMSVNDVWEYQTNDVYTTTGDNIAVAELMPIGGEGEEIVPTDYLGNGNAPGVLTFEAADVVSAYNSPMLIVIVDNVEMYRFRLPMSITPAREMYGWINGRHLSGETESRATILNKTWGEESVKSLVFLHGANVSEADAEKWGDALFKRLFLSRVHVNFYNVDWRSNIGSSANYHENASNAFVVASQLVTEITNSIPGEKVVMAHSLGNMVVSSMIQDYGLQVSKYIMCNSAVPAEAYDTALTPTNVLIHKDWSAYPRKAFANEWYKCFEEDVGDDRQLLTWGGRFANVTDYVVNFYSTGDHVLELEDNNSVWATDGYENWDQMFERYSWHKQELWKGRKGMIFNMGTTDWAGWSIRENILGQNVIQPTNAWLMSATELKTNTVFKLQPESMNTNSIPLLLRGAHLANGIPSRTPASGAMKWGDDGNLGRFMFNLNDIAEDATILRPNGWVSRSNGWFGNWGTRWMHSDIKDVAYFYVFKFFEKVKDTGGLE